MTVRPDDPEASPTQRRGVAVLAFVAGGVVAAQAGALLLMGHPLICACGVVEAWYPDPAGPGTSQHLLDWYSFSHVLHGILFYGLLSLVAPRTSVGTRLLLAVGLEVGWEIVENTPFVIDRYRQSALARGYFGDSVVNSLSDTVMMAIGFGLARVLPIWGSALVVVATELALAVMIRDNLTLNIIQLIHPLEAINRWQVGG
jgi:hypothetical protein